MFGILNLNKPAGWTSRDVVNRVSRIVGRKVKCGHAGTLDPLATGVLLVCIGKATKLVPYIHEFPKSYDGSFLFGKKSETDDLEGTLESVPIPADLTEETIQNLLPEFLGEIEQVPPVYSAVWVKGERAYDLARRGETVELSARKVNIDRLELSQFDNQSMTLSMTCGTGTYVRSLGRDIARRAGTEAVMSSLTRTSIGPFTLEDSISVDELDQERIQQKLQSPLILFERFPKYTANAEEIQLIRHGREVSIRPQGFSGNTGAGAHGGADAEKVIVIDEQGQLVAITENRKLLLAPQMVFPSPE